MPFVLGFLGLLFPRVVLFLVWLFGHDYLGRAYQQWIWPVLGFIFFPLTTLVFAYANNSLTTGGIMSPLGWLLVALAVLADLGCMKGGQQASRRRRDRDD